MKPNEITEVLDRPVSQELLARDVTRTYVRTTLSAEQAGNLPSPDGSDLVEIKPTKSMADRLRRMLGGRKR
jgi:hypothetical protein